MFIQNFARNPVLVNNRLSAASYRTQTLASNLAKSLSLPLSVRLSTVSPRLISWLIQSILAAQPITGKRWGRVGTGLPRGQERVPPSERNRRLSPYCALHFPVGTFPGRELSSMKLIMTLHTENECFPVSGNHESLPCFLTILNVRELPNMMDFKVSLLLATILALLSIVSLPQLCSRAIYERLGNEVDLVPCSP